MAGDGTLMGLIGAADNFGEPTPYINRRETILGLCISFMVLSWIFVGLRLSVRLFWVKAPGWDDFFVVLSLLTMSVGLASICVATKYGLGRHLLHLDFDSASAFLHSFYVFNGSYAMSTALIKISLLLQYMRVYERGTRLYNICRAFIIIIALWGAAYSMIAWVPCVPVSDYWTVFYEQDISGLRCYGYGSQSVREFKAIYESHAAVNMVLDLVVMALAVPMYFEPGATGRTRLGLVGILTMGTIVNIFSIWRFAATIKTSAATYPTFDPTWYGPSPIVMAGLETASACICASIPVFWGPLLASASHLLGQIFVTKEVHVTTRHFDSSEAVNVVEMRGAPQGYNEDNDKYVARSASRLDWVGKDGVQQSCDPWSK
ncbi:hypothetical protein VTJ49DRAFT_2178 [Mycothermus thermophilus]|uniref:Rhodopsin domain-containing protein n=1 Tax=Humicola insolens TaxID=85995 RepID=A0ABR3VAS7_HUMIN